MLEGAREEKVGRKRKCDGGTSPKEMEADIGQRRRGWRKVSVQQGGGPQHTPLGAVGTCWRLLLQTQCCQPPSAPLESRQEVQLGRR